MITSSGPLCDVCGNYILFLDPEEQVNFFSVKQIHATDLCCHNRCKEAILECSGDYKKLPDGPLRKAYQIAEGKINHE